MTVIFQRGFSPHQSMSMSGVHKVLKSDPENYAPVVVLLYNATKAK